jgi:valyl-tRNA synthetase
MAGAQYFQHQYFISIMELSKNFQHSEAEQKWYQYWMDKGYFYSTPDERPAYTIVMPPPNVTGILHMGHALNNTVQDVLIRRAKMQGFNTCWVPGTDHASIATEAKVVAMLREKGIDKNKLSRDEFLGYAWEWKEKYGGIILSQLKKLGCSLDWNRTHFTMDKEYYAAVMRVFVELYDKGLIYRGVKMINWDPKAKTALSDEEVVHKQANSKLYYVQYKLDTEKDEYITIATVRPETILGDTAICVHPEDPRYAHLKGQYAFVPLINRRVPIIFDDYIDLEFGTGALKVTPAHDINDYNLGIKYKLQVIDTLNDDGTLSEAAGMYVGEDRFSVRKKIIEDLKLSGNYVKEEDYSNQVGFSERTDAVIEPRLSMQWWCDMAEMAKPALDTVMEENVKFFPPKFKNLYRHWMSNIKDWCISRQLWWGQRIPAWYDAEGEMYIAENEEQAYNKYLAAKPEGKQGDLRQDDDCLDTWFSSWLWPMQVFGWNENPDNKELAYYYPTNTLVTAPEIIFFWVARMIMAGETFLDKKPFDKVYFTGIVRDKQGRKMSKSLGNSPDLLELIEVHGADAVRFSVMIASPAGNDLLYDESMIEQGRNFGNKMWNAMKLVKMWEARVSAKVTTEDTFAIDWMEERIKQVELSIEELLKDFRLSEALKNIYSLIWDDFCSWYLEWVKPPQDVPMSAMVYEKTVDIYESLLQLLHPFMPFVTEEIYQMLREQKVDLMNRQLPTFSTPDEALLAEGSKIKDLITAVRDARVKNNLKPKDVITLAVDTQSEAFYNKAKNILMRQINAEEISFTKEAVQGSISLVLGIDKLYISSNVAIDTTAQKEQLQKDLDYQKGFLVSVEKKLSNEKFVANAKAEIIEAERKKQSDALAKIKTIEESLSLL